MVDINTYRTRIVCFSVGSESVLDLDTLRVVGVVGFVGMLVWCFNPFPNDPWFLRVCSTNLSKTLWEKEKLLVTNNFSFSHNVFYLFGVLSAIFIKFEIVVCKLFQFGRVQNLSFGKGLIHNCVIL